VINESLKMPGAVELSHDGNYLHSPKFITYPNKGKKGLKSSTIFPDFLGTRAELVSSFLEYILDDRTQVTSALGKKKVQYFARHIEMEYIQIIKLSLTPIRIVHHW
jgi:hypothetical protein